MTSIIYTLWQVSLLRTVFGMCWTSTKKWINVLSGWRTQFSHTAPTGNYTNTLVFLKARILHADLKENIYEYDCTFSFKIRTCMYILNIFPKKTKKHSVNAFCRSGKKSAYIIHTKKCIVKKEAIHHTFKKLYIQRSCLLIVYCWVKHLPDIS